MLDLCEIFTKLITNVIYVTTSKEKVPFRSIVFVRSVITDQILLARYVEEVESISLTLSETDAMDNLSLEIKVSNLEERVINTIFMGLVIKDDFKEGEKGDFYALV